MGSMSIKKIGSILLAAFGGIVLIGGIGVLAWAFISDSGTSGIPTPETGEVGEPEVLVNIHFGDEERTPQDPVDLAVIERSTSRNDLIAYTLEEMIAGPTEEEQQDGLYSELILAADSESNCDGDFRIDNDETTFVVQLCRDTENYNDNDANIVTIAQILQTMSQFPDAEDVVILDRDDNCFGDTSGDNDCLDRIPSALAR